MKLVKMDRAVLVKMVKPRSKETCSDYTELPFSLYIKARSVLQIMLMSFATSKFQQFEGQTRNNRDRDIR